MGDAMLDHAPADPAELNARFQSAAPQQVLEFALRNVGPVALVSSFGAESAVLLHMMAQIAPATPVLFLETGMLFPETLAYQQQLAARLGLLDLRLIRPLAAVAAGTDPDGTLHRRDTDTCCALRKIEPLARALLPFDAMISGRKRFQGGQRQGLELFEAGDGTRWRINPLAHWDADALRAYAKVHDLPPHPLVARGFPSIGCMPCTSPVAPGEATRAGRWRGQDKEECGIHLIDGHVVRAREAALTPNLMDGDLLVRDDGFHPLEGDPLAIAPDTPVEDLAARFDAPLIAIDFPAMTDGRGFTLARQLRAMGYAGRLRATGRLIADQYAMARRVGFDEVQISAELAARQPEAQWRARADWRSHDHRARLAG